LSAEWACEFHGGIECRLFSRVFFKEVEVGERSVQGVLERAVGGGVGVCVAFFSEVAGESGSDFGVTASENGLDFLRGNKGVTNK